jgi:hypothetical protein
LSDEDVMRSLSLLVLILAASPLPLEAQLRQAPAPRTRPGPAIDPLTALISGRITAADTGSPVRGAEVRTISESGVNRLATTDADGRFEVRDLPAGTYRVAVSKSGFVAAQFGQRWAGEAPRTVELSLGERASADVALLRGGVIAGRVLDRFGEPSAGVRVQALRPRMVSGRRRLQSVGAGDETDDTGSFRVYGLAPGDYYVIARPPGAAALPAKGTAPIYYPGTADFTEAQRITVSPAAEASALLQLVPVRTSTVSGQVVGPDGAPVDATVNLTSESVGLGYVNAAQGEVPFMMSTHAEADGSFTLEGVPPGPYSVGASSMMFDGFAAGLRDARAGVKPSAEPMHLTATVPLAVSADVSGLTLTLSAGGTISGRFVRDPGASQPLPQGLGVSVSGPHMTRMNTGPNGTFRIIGLSGDVRISVGGLPDDWTVRSIVANDRDITDSTISLANGQDLSVRILVTDRLTYVNGTVSSRAPGRSETVVVFSEDAARWAYPSRFVRAVRVDDRGAFEIAGLPPGERYLATAVEFLEEGDEQDPEVLERLRAGATPFALAEGERRSLQLRALER